MSKNIGNLKVAISIEITETNFSPQSTLPKVLEMVKSLPKEFDGLEVKCYYGWLKVHKDSNIYDLVELSNMKHDKFHQQKDKP